MEKDAMMMKKEKLQRGEFIAHGTFGDVYEGDYDGQKVAIKALDFGIDRDEERSFKLEASVWSKLDHPNVAKFIGATQMKFPENSGKKDSEKLYWCMVSEFLEGGTLDSFLEKNKKLPLKTVLRLALDIAKGLSYLHSEKIVHRDVKVTNMVLDGEGTVKLKMTGDTGTVMYLAPEVQRCDAYDHKCDVYSFGVCLWEIYHCRCAETAEKALNGATPRISIDCPVKLTVLMTMCWYPYYQARPEMSEVVTALEEMSEVVTALEEMSAVEEAKARKKTFKGCFGFL